MCIRGSLVFLFFFLFRGQAFAQESPYIVTYDHYLEEPGSLEVEYFSTVGTQRAGNDFHAFWAEFEYGATAWWTTELYIDGQTTFHDSTVFTGFRWENRFRPLEREHFINPVIYIEYEQISEADKIIKEVEGHDVESDHADPNSVLSQEHDHELEFKLLLSKTFKGWNVAVNPLATKNLSPNNPWEFGYALGASRPLALKASPHRCSFCRENLRRRHRIVRRPGRHRQFWPARHFPLSCPRCGLESSLGLDSSPVTGVRFERQQSSLAIALGSLPRVFGLRGDRHPLVRRP